MKATYKLEMKKKITEASDLRFIRHFISLCTKMGLGLFRG